MKPRSLLDPNWEYVNAENTDVRRTFEIARCGGTNCPSWWSCKQHGCYQLAKERYGEAVVRFEPRPEHDVGPNGQRLKEGR